MKKEKVAIIGASNKMDRYSNKAMHALEEHEHEVFLVHPRLQTIEGHNVYECLEGIEEDLDTITIYISPPLQKSIADEILSSRVKRVIFNPGTENPELAKRLEAAGIKVEEACTLVLLSTDQF